MLNWFAAWLCAWVAGLNFGLASNPKYVKYRLWHTFLAILLAIACILNIWKAIQ